MQQRLEERLAYQLARTEHELRVVLDNALRDLGVTLTQWTVLTFLVREPGLSAADLARRSFISQQGVAGILTRLERAGLVARAPHPTHGRIREVTVTSAGRALAAYGDQQVAELEERLHAALGVGEEARLADALARCRRVLHEFGADGIGRVPGELPGGS